MVPACQRLNLIVTFCLWRFCVMSFVFLFCLFLGKLRGLDLAWPLFSIFFEVMEFLKSFPSASNFNNRWSSDIILTPYMSLSQIQPSASEEVETQMNNLKCSLTEFLPAGAPAAFSPSRCEQQRRPERGNATSASDSRLPAMAPLKVFRMTLYVCFLLCCLALPLQGKGSLCFKEKTYIFCFCTLICDANGSKNIWRA